MLMSLESTLGNLKKIGALTPYTAPVGEIKQHVDRAANLIGDAQKIQNTLDTRFAISYDICDTRIVSNNGGG